MTTQRRRGFGQKRYFTKRAKPKVRACRVCGCTDNDCRGCVERTGKRCSWVQYDLCSACVPAEEMA